MAAPPQQPATVRLVQAVRPAVALMAELVQLALSVALAELARVVLVASATALSAVQVAQAAQVALNAGTFNMSNSMTSVGQSAAGIMVAGQNSGMNAMVQQAVTVQANLNVGK